MSHYLRKMPILFVLVFGIFVASLVVNYKHQQLRLVDDYRQHRFKKEDAVSALSKLGYELGQNEKWDDLRKELETARQADLIDFYVLQKQGHATWFGEAHDDLEKVDIAYDEANGQKVFKNETTFETTNIGQDYRLTIGVDQTAEEYVASRSSEMRNMIIEEAFYSFLIVFVVGLWALRDLVLVVREMKRGKKANLKKLRTRSAESEVFLRGMTGYTQAIEDLELENHKLGRQVLPSLQKEIHSGRKPPYDFYCTMVRTDINRFSTIYNTHNVTEFMETINRFFDEVSRTVARYGGLVHEFVGDEVIYYFKDDEHENSFAVALSAIRDINVIAERFHLQTLESRGYPFTVKSSLSHGKVRFGPLVNGFTIAGSVLIESVRILSYINERDENVVYFDGVHSARVKPVISSEERLVVTLKGYSHETRLYQYLSHEPLDSRLASLSRETVQDLTLYRSNADLVAILKDLRSHASQRPVVVTLSAITLLREPYLASSTDEIAAAIVDWIAELQTKIEADSSLDLKKIVSAVTMLFMNLVPKSEVKPEQIRLVKSLLTSTDDRVVANALEVLTYFEVQHKESKVEKMRLDNLRINANAIVQEGSADLMKVMKRLRVVFKSGKPPELASALYAIGELAAHHRAQDPAFYAQQTEFLNMIQSLEGYAQHLTVSVRRQAMIAARKAADPAVIEAIRKAVRDSESELLQEELTRYLESVNESAPTSNSSGAA